MSFKSFEKEMPDIYILADSAERAIDFDHVIALGHMKEIGRLLVTKILMNEKVKIGDKNPFLNLEALMNIEILTTTLKQLEYFDTRESAMFIEPSKVKNLMFNIYYLTSWYFKTYVNDHFSPPPLLLRPQMATFETYQGQMSNGMKSGKGVYRWSDGSKYEGQWYKDSEYGFGVKEYANGDSYRGEWKEGLFHGKGIYKWNDGTKFEGNWQDNLEHGYGVKTYKDGSIQKGFWTLGELVFTEDQLRESKTSITKKED